MIKKELPIGIQTFNEIHTNNMYYVDKTAFTLRSIEKGHYYHLSRPRRFRKSLFLDTLKEFTEGNKTLFEPIFCRSMLSILTAVRFWNGGLPILKSQSKSFQQVSQFVKSITSPMSL